MSNNRPYYDPTVLEKYRQQREQERALLVDAFKAAWDFGKAIILPNRASGNTWGIVTKNKKSE